MKKLIVSAASMLLASGLIAQSGDTLKIPLGKYDFISIGTKVYEIDVNLKEVPVLQFLNGTQHWGEHIMPAIGGVGQITPAVRGWAVGSGVLTIDSSFNPSQVIYSSETSEDIHPSKPKHKTKHKK